MNKLSWKIIPAIKRLQLEEASIFEQIPFSSSELVLKFSFENLGRKKKSKPDWHLAQVLSTTFNTPGQVQHMQCIPSLSYRFFLIKVNKSNSKVLPQIKCKTWTSAGIDLILAVEKVTWKPLETSRCLMFHPICLIQYFKLYMTW